MKPVGNRFKYPIAFVLLALLLSLAFLAGVWRKEEDRLRSHLFSTTRSIAELARRHLEEHEEMRTAFAFETTRVQPHEFEVQAADFITRHPDVEAVVWLKPDLKPVFRYPPERDFPEQGSILTELIPLGIQGSFRTGRKDTYYTPVVMDLSGNPVFFAVRPVLEGPDSLLSGYLVTACRVDRMIDLVLPPSMIEGYALDLLLDSGRTVLLRGSGEPLDKDIFADLFLEPSRLVVQLTRYDVSFVPYPLVLSGLFVLLLIGASGWSMVRIRSVITSREATEAALLESEERYRTLFTNSRSVMLLIDSQTGQIEDANEAALRFYGYGIEVIRNRPLSDINTLNPEDIRTEMEEARTERRNFFRFRHRLASGEIRDVEVFTGPVRLKGREFLLSTIHDVTERTGLQTELDRTMSLQARILENAFVGILYIRQQRVVWANPVAGTLFGEAHEKLVGLSPEDFLGAADEVRQIRERATPLLEQGKPYQEEVRITRKDGRPVWLDIFAKSATPSGLEEGSIWVLLDISARKETESLLQASLAEKEVLLREIHHRVKNNFQVVLSLLNLKARQFEDAGIQEILRDLGNRVRAMSSVHESLYRSPNMSAIDSREYLDSMARDIVRTARPGSKVSLETELESHPLPVEVAIPCGLILTELLTNSLKHAYPEGQSGITRVRFSAAPADKTGAGDVFCLEVSDDGQGVQDDTRPQNPASLGLSLVRSLAEKQLGGTFRLDRGPGTQCLVTFPAQFRRSGSSGGVQRTTQYQEVIP